MNTPELPGPSASPISRLLTGPEVSPSELIVVLDRMIELLAVAERIHRRFCVYYRVGTLEIASYVEDGGIGAGNTIVGTLKEAVAADELAKDVQLEYEREVVDRVREAVRIAKASKPIVDPPGEYDFNFADWFSDLINYLDGDGATERNHENPPSAMMRSLRSDLEDIRYWQEAEAYATAARGMFPHTECPQALARN